MWQAEQVPSPWNFEGNDLKKSFLPTPSTIWALFFLSSQILSNFMGKRDSLLFL